MITYSEYLKRFFGEEKVQKISVNAGFSCPNRDGTIGTNGCIYCRVDSFTPNYCLKEKDIVKQIEEGKRFFSRKYPKMKYLVYFQSYTNTYNISLEKLREIYKTVLNVQDVVGIAIGTRPDTIDDGILEILSDINKNVPVFLEIGAETSRNDTLALINRHHTWADVKDAVKRAADSGLHCGLHLIVGLPNETEEDILTTVRESCKLPIETIKLHQLQILYDTPLFYLWERKEINVKCFTFEEYLELCKKIIEIIPDGIIIERFLSQSPPELVASPKWGIKNYQFFNYLNRPKN